MLVPTGILEIEVERVTPLPKTYQKPKANHPWRRYSNAVKQKILENADVVTVRDFLEDVLEHWDDYEITMANEFEGSYHHRIASLPQSKQASYIAGVLRRNYIEQRQPTF